MLLLDYLWTYWTWYKTFNISTMSFKIKIAKDFRLSWLSIKPHDSYVFFRFLNIWNRKFWIKLQQIYFQLIYNKYMDDVVIFDKGNGIQIHYLQKILNFRAKRLWNIITCTIFLCYLNLFYVNFTFFVEDIFWIFIIVETITLRSHKRQGVKHFY